MTQFSEPVSITPILLSQDELRERFVTRNLHKKLIADYEREVTDPWNVGIGDVWFPVRKEIFFINRSAGKRAALIYWTKDEKPELIVISLTDEGVRYKWNKVPAVRPWPEYQYKEDVG